MERGKESHACSPRRYEKRRALEDLEALREAASAHDDALTRRQAIAAEARRLQQQAETERRVSILAHRQQEQQPVQEQQARHAQSHQASEELSGSEDDWEVEEVDDGSLRLEIEGRVAATVGRATAKNHLFLNPPAQTRPHCCLRSSAPADERPRS